MSLKLFDMLKKIYEDSKLPVAVTDSSAVVKWKNKASGQIFSEGTAVWKAEHGGFSGPEIINTISNEQLYSFNAVKAEDRESGESYYIVELIRSDKLSDILNTAAIRDYVLYLCAKIKNAAGMMTNSADEIYDNVSCGLFDSEMITERLNIIDKGIMSITKEIIQPDQFYSLLKMDEKEMTLSADNELRRIADEASAVLGRNVKIVFDCDKNIFFHMERSIFEAVVAGMAEKCCRCGGAPEMLSFSASRLSDIRAEVIVRSIHITNNKNKTDQPHGMDIAEAELQSPERDVFFNYMCDILCARHKAVFTKAELPNGFIFKMEFDIVTGGTTILEPETEYSAGSSRFSTVRLMLSDVTQQQRYGFYDIDAEDEAE